MSLWLVSKFNTGLKSHLKQGLSEPDFYGDLVYKFKIDGRNDFAGEFRKIIIRYKKNRIQHGCYVTETLHESLI